MIIPHTHKPSEILQTSLGGYMGGNLPGYKQWKVAIATGKSHALSL